MNNMERLSELPVDIPADFFSIFREGLPSGTYKTIESNGIYTNGVFDRHLVHMCFLLDYHDWCKFEKSDLYRSLVSYLSEVRK